MKLTTGFWRAHDGSKWHVDWVGKRFACGHSCDVSESVRRWDACGIDSTGFDDEFGEINLISPWTETKLRPWKANEVPVGAILRNIGGRDPYKWMIVAVCSDGITTCGGNEVLTRDAKLFLEKCEHSIDGGKTWLPCGVLEESK